MGIKTVPLSRLEAHLRETLSECADSGQTFVIELPDQRLVAIQALEPSEDDGLVDELLASNPAFQALAQLRAARGFALLALRPLTAAFAGDWAWS